MDGKFLIGYARVSTEDQDLSLQINALREYGVPEKSILTEKKSGKSLKGRLLHDILTLILRKGDRLVVWRLDRLGRSVKELVQIVEMIEEAGADLVSLRDNIDTTTAGGRLYFHMMAAIAEFERNLTSERTKAGMQAKKLADPTFRAGAKNKITDVPARLDRLQHRYDSGEMVLVPKLKQRGPDKGKRIGFTLQRRGQLGALLADLNECAEGEKPIGNTLTISRWLEAGAPGLVLRNDDKEDF